MDRHGHKAICFSNDFAANDMLTSKNNGFRRSAYALCQRHNDLVGKRQTACNFRLGFFLIGIGMNAVRKRLFAK
jgi:hypothetical protein